MSLTPTIQHVERFIVTGFSARTQNSDEFNEGCAKIPSLWQTFYASELALNANIFAVYSNYDSDANGAYAVTVGVSSSSALTQLSTVTVHAGKYLIFQGRGAMPAALIETWKRVWTFFATNKSYQRTFISDFEAYSGTEQVMIYIGVE